MVNMSNAFEFFLISLQIIIVLLHICGLYLLLCHYKHRNCKVEDVLLINLSVVEILITALYIACSSLSTSDPKVSISLHIVSNYINTFVRTTLYIVYYMSMFYIVINKFLEVYLNISYPIYYDTTKSEYMLGLTWAASIVFGVTTMSMGKRKMQTITFGTPLLYVYFSLDVVFICIAIASYSYIFYKYRHTRTNPNAQAPPQSAWSVFKNSRFYVSALLVITFIIFTVVPHMCYTQIWKIRTSFSLETAVMILKVLLIMNRVSFLSDAVIYIFLHPPIRLLLLKKLRAIKGVEVANSDEQISSMT